MAAYGQYLPNLVAGASYNYNRGNNLYSSTTPILVDMGRSQYAYQLTSSVNLFTGYYNYANKNAAKLNQEMAGLALDRVKQQIALDVTTSYLQVILDRRIVELDSNNLATSLIREDQLTMLADIGRRARTDLYQQQAQTSNDKLLLINARSKMNNDKLILLQKLRIDSVTNYEIAEIPVNDDAEAGRYGNVDQLVQQGFQSRPDLRAAELNMNYADWNIKKYRSGYLPQVSLGAGVYNNGAWFNHLSLNGNVETPPAQTEIPTQLYKNTYGLVGLNASWNIFDRYVTRSNVAIARISADNSRIDLQDTRIAVGTNIRQAHNDYVNAVQQMETVGLGLTAAQKAYEAVNGKYKEGATDFVSESNAQQVLLQAQQNKVQASVNVMLQKKTLDYFTGSAIE